MELSINKITNEQIDILILNSKSATNSLGIVWPYHFAFESTNLNWYDISFAIENGYLSHKSAIEHAEFELSNEEYPKNVLDLAILTADEAIYPHSIQPYVTELAEMVSEQEKSMTKNKMLYLALKWIFEHKANYEDPLKVIEIIYSNFDYPKSISHFVRYMPMVGPDLGSTELNVERLFSSWKSFIEKQEILFGKNN